MTLVLQQVAAFHMNRDADLTTDAGNAPGSVPASGAPPALSAAVSTSAPTLVSSPSASAFAGAAGTSTVAPPAVVEDDGWDVLDPALCAQVSNDEVLARACELMGSNLFESAISDAEKGECDLKAEEGEEVGPSPEILYERQLRQLADVGLLQRYSKEKVR